MWIINTCSRCGQPLNIGRLYNEKMGIVDEHDFPKPGKENQIHEIAPDPEDIDTDKFLDEMIKDTHAENMIKKNPNLIKDLDLVCPHCGAHLGGFESNMPRKRDWVWGIIAMVISYIPIMLALVMLTGGGIIEFFNGLPLRPWLFYATVLAIDSLVGVYVALKNFQESRMK